jgi:hypothetical protein
LLTFFHHHHLQQARNTAALAAVPRRAVPRAGTAARRAVPRARSAGLRCRALYTEVAKIDRAQAALTKYVNPALALLPPKMNTVTARQLLLAIGLQESNFVDLVQKPGGQAHGYWQFERGNSAAAADVLQRKATKDIAEALCKTYGVKPDPDAVWSALADPDKQVFAAAFARLNLYNDPNPLPTDENSAWDTYIRAWKPGTPRRETWGLNYKVGNLVGQ